MLLPVVQRNKQRGKAKDAYASAHGLDALGGGLGGGGALPRRGDEWLSSLEEIREYDVPYHHRVAIDTGRRVGLWCVFSKALALIWYRRPNLVLPSFEPPAHTFRALESCWHAGGRAPLLPGNESRIVRRS